MKWRKPTSSNADRDHSEKYRQSGGLPAHRANLRSAFGDELGAPPPGFLQALRLMANVRANAGRLFNGQASKGSVRDFPA